MTKLPSSPVVVLLTTSFSRSLALGSSSKTTSSPGWAIEPSTTVPSMEPGFGGASLAATSAGAGAGLSFTVTVSLESPTRPSPLVARAVTTILPLESLGTASCAFQMRQVSQGQRQASQGPGFAASGPVFGFQEATADRRDLRSERRGARQGAVDTANEVP